MNNSPAYSQIQCISMVLGREQVELITKPGLPEWDSFSPSSNLFFDNGSIKPGDSMLLFGCHLGALASAITRQYSQSHVYITDHLHTSLDMTHQTLEKNSARSVDILTEITIPKNLENEINIVYIQIPKGRMLGRRWLLEAYKALVSGGKLYIGGANKSGIQSAIKDAKELFGNGSVLAYKKSNRIAVFIKKSAGIPNLEWTRYPGIAPATWYEFNIILSSHSYRIRSLPGVFSYDHLDEGTRMLLNASSIPPGAHVLDVGCGYGIIGLYAAIQGAGLVHLVDNDLLAIASSRETMAMNEIRIAQVFSGDLLDPIGSKKYNLILSNPPFHSGQLVDFQIAEAMIAQSFQALKPGGRLEIVSNRFIRYDNLIKSIFGNVAILAESGKFHVLSGLKSESGNYKA
jgi:16S rRNA (guanine1207-N2)-methyltransferase